jgi:hypothetical protein
MLWRGMSTVMEGVEWVGQGWFSKPLLLFPHIAIQTGTRRVVRPLNGGRRTSFITNQSLLQTIPSETSCHLHTFSRRTR